MCTVMVRKAMGNVYLPWELFCLPVIENWRENLSHKLALGLFCKSQDVTGEYLKNPFTERVTEGLNI